MSSHQDSYYYAENDSEHAERQLSYMGQLGPPTTTMDDEAAFGYLPDGFLPSLQQGVETDATYNNDLYYASSDAQFYDRPSFDYDGPLNQFAFSPQGPVRDSYPEQQFAHDPYGINPFQGIQDSSEQPGPSVAAYPYSSSTQLSSTDCGGPVGRTDTRARPNPDSTRQLDGVSTGMKLLNMDSEQQYSHLGPVAIAGPSNQILATGPSRQTSSPERKRLLPSPAAEEISTERRVVPRHDGAQSVHSSDTNRGHNRAGILVRGPFIPQERYTTSSISSYNTPEYSPAISFNLDNPERTGIPITDVLDKTEAFSRLRDNGETFNMGKKTFTMRIQWPGYRPWSKTISAMDWKKSRGPITRAKLAEATAISIRDLLGKYRDEPCDPDYVRWNVGPNGIQLHQICLVELHQVSKGSWQPRLCLIEPSQ